MIRDRSSNFTTTFDAVLADAGIRTVLCNVRTPRMTWTMFSARIQHAVRKRREPTGNNGQSAGPSGPPGQARRPTHAAEAPLRDTR